MTPTQETLKYFITLLKINRINDAKNKSVRVQDFAEAARLRDIEASLEKQLMTIDRLEELDAALDGREHIEDERSSPDPNILVRALEEIHKYSTSESDRIFIETALNNYKNK